MADTFSEAIDLLHCVGFLYLRHGQPYRAVVLLIVAAQTAPERTDLLRTLAGALVAARLGDQALGVLDRLWALAPEDAADPMFLLLRSRALLLLGRRDEAVEAFRGRRRPGTSAQRPSGSAMQEAS